MKQVERFIEQLNLYEKDILNLSLESMREKYPKLSIEQIRKDQEELLLVIFSLAEQEQNQSKADEDKKK
jgi:hypothetical protein